MNSNVSSILKWMIRYIYYWSLLFLDNVNNIIKSWAYFESAWSRLEQTKVVCTHFDIYNIYFYQYKQMIMMLCYAMDQRTNTSISQLKDFLEIARFSFFYWAIILLYRYFLIVSIRWNYLYAFCFCFVCCLLFCLFMLFSA